MNQHKDAASAVQEFWKLAISTQIGMFQTTANALDSVLGDMQGSCLRETYKTNSSCMGLYFQTIEQTGGQLVHMQSEALRRSSDALKTILSKMEDAGMPREQEAKQS
jgi:hypothetical protein